MLESRDTRRWSGLIVQGIVILALLTVLAKLSKCQPVNPNIYIDNDTGIALPGASGAPEGMGAQQAPSGCSTPGSSATVTATAHGMSGFPTDGSTALYMATASGRQWFKVTGFPNANQITVTPNVNTGGVAVDCAVGGRLAGPLGGLTISTTRGLCPSIMAGWTVTIVNTGTTYIETNTQGCPLTASGSVTSDGRQVIRGDDPDNPTPIEIQYNGNYIFATGGTLGIKYENLEFIRNAAGTTGAPFAIGSGTDLAPVAINVTVRQTSGTWAMAFSAGGRPDIVMSSQFHGPFTTACAPSNSELLAINNYWNGCSGTTSAFPTLENPWLFNIVNNGGVDQSIFSGAVNNGSGGFIFYNTMITTGAAGIAPGANDGSLYSGNYVDEASTASGACFNAGTNTNALLGAATFGEPTVMWRGNAANTCTTARYGGGLGTTAQGAATDVDMGNQFDLMFQNAGALDYFPTNALAKSTTVFPGSTFPFQTPAAPVSTMTVGAAQLPGGGGGVSAYAY